MDTEYIKWYSPILGREMECKRYGHAGRPILYIPCQDGRFYDFENFHMTDVWAPWLETGRAMVFSLDTLNAETWSNKNGDPRWRSERHESWMEYIRQELAPFILDETYRRSGEDHGHILAFGCSLGATHAANLYFRYPDLFDGLLALSGIYTAEYGFDGYMDELVYANSPVHYLAGMEPGHPFLDMYRDPFHRAIVCVGQGAWEQPQSTAQLGDICRDKGIPVWCDFWGYDVNHDWPWWYKQVEYFAPQFLGEA